MTDETRRRLLKTAGIALTAGLAGCAGDDDGGDGEGTDTPASTETTAADGGTTATEPAAGETETTTEPTETETEPTTTTTEETTTTGGSSLSGSRLAITNVGFSAWEVTEDESGSVAQTGTENPTLSFEVGQRYVVENGGWSAHPFAIRAADDSALLSQSADGSFEGDGAVDWVDEGERLAFTFTQELADQASYYICTVHSSMRGSVGAGGDTGGNDSGNTGGGSYSI